MKKIILVIISFLIIFSQTGSVFAAVKSYRAIIVDKNLNIKKIISYTLKDTKPRVYLENEYGIELPYTESLERHYQALKSSLNFNKKGVIYDEDKSYIINLLSRLFYVVLHSLGGN